MTRAAIALVIAAALLHATWNVLTKRAADPLMFLWSSMLVAALGLLPFACAIGFDGPLGRDRLPYVAGSIVIHAVYFLCLSRAYRLGDFSLVYPIARGLGVALVPMLAFGFFGERPTVLGAAGIALVVGGIAASGIAALRTSAAAHLAAVRWAVLTGLCIAAYSIVDSAGARAMHVVPYLCLMSLGSLLCCAPIVLSRRAALVHEWRKNGRTILLASTMNLSGYLLVLTAYSTSKTGYVVACRELSIALSPIFGRVLLGEGKVPARVASACVILGGVLCVALAR